MAGKVETRRKALRETLINIAEQTIATEGLSALRARDLAAQAGCAVGAIYNVFGDLSDLVLTVNARTFHQLGADVATALAQAPQDATEQLVVMAQAYHHFAAQNPHSWRALFDFERAEDETAPDWYMTEMGRLFTYISTPLGIIFPEQSADERALLTRALFSSIHGIILLSLNAASAGIPMGEVDDMIALILRQLTRKQIIS